MIFYINLLQGYRLAYPNQQFELTLPENDIKYEINKDLYYQMLDKIVGNAVGFSKANSVIQINLIQQSSAYQLQVINYGVGIT